MSTKLRYLHHPPSQPCRSARQFMVENDIDFDDEVVDITTNINETKEFRDTYNPTGQVPILVDGDFTVWENVAIGRYLNEKFDCPSHWFGSTLRERSLINQFVQWYAYTLRLGGDASAGRAITFSMSRWRSWRTTGSRTAITCAGTR